MKILTIFGTRPQFIKVNSISNCIKYDIDEVIVNTGQHYDFNLTNIFLKAQYTKLNYNLNTIESIPNIQIGNIY